MALPTFVRDQMLGLDDAARLREALRTGDWWQVTKSSAAIATELGGTVSLVGFPIAAGIGALNRRLGGAAVAAATPPVPPVPPRPALPAPQAMPALTATASPSSAGPFNTSLPVPPRPTLPVGPIPVGPGPIPVGAGGRPVIPVRRPGLAPGAGLASLTARTAAPDLGSLVRPTIPVPPRPFVQQAFPTVSPQPAAAVTRPTTPPSSGVLYDEFGNLRSLDGGVSVDDIILRRQAEEAAGLPRRSPQEIEADILAERAAQRSSFVPEFPMTDRPPLAEIIRAPRRQPGMNPAARGVRPPAPTTTLSGELSTPPFVSRRIPSGGAGGGDVPDKPIVRLGQEGVSLSGNRPPFRPPSNVPGRTPRSGPRNPASFFPEDAQAVGQARRIQEGQVSPRWWAEKFPDPPAAAPESRILDVDEIFEGVIDDRVLYRAGIQSRVGEGAMTLDEFIGLDPASRKQILVDIQARRAQGPYVEYRRSRKQRMVSATAEDATVAQKWWTRDPRTGKVKTGRAPGYLDDRRSAYEDQIDQMYARIEADSLRQKGGRTGSTVAEGRLDTKITRNVALRGRAVPSRMDAGSPGVPILPGGYVPSVVIADSSAGLLRNIQKIRLDDAVAGFFTDVKGVNQWGPGAAKLQNRNAIGIPVIKRGQISPDGLRGIQPGKAGVELLSDADLVANKAAIDEALSRIPEGSPLVSALGELEDAATVLFADAPETLAYLRQRIFEQHTGSSLVGLPGTVGERMLRQIATTRIDDTLARYSGGKDSNFGPRLLVSMSATIPQELRGRMLQILRKATPEQRDFIKRFGMRRLAMIQQATDRDSLALAKHSLIGGYGGRVSGPTDGVITMKGRNRIGIAPEDTVRLRAVGLNKNGDVVPITDREILDFSELNAYDNDLISKEFADLVAEVWDRTMQNLERGRTVRLESGMEVFRRPTPAQAAEETIRRGARRRAKPTGNPPRTTFKNDNPLDK